MGGKLKVDCEMLEDAISTMEMSYESLKKFSEDGFKSELEVLEKMNSDFVEKIERVLEILEDYDMKKLDENIVKYIGESQKIYEDIRKADNILAGNE